MVRGDKLSLHVKVARDIINNIERGVYQPGDKLRRQVEFAQLYNTSCSTIKKSFLLLQNRGLIVSVKGHGSFVKGFRGSISTTGSYRQNDESVEPSAARMTTRMVHSQLIYANTHIANQLKIPFADSCYHIQLLRVFGTDPVCLQNIYIPCDVACNLDIDDYDISKESLFKLYCTHFPSNQFHSDKSLRAILCPPEVCGVMNLQENVPILFIKSYLFCGDQTIEYNESYERTDLRPHEYIKNITRDS